MCMSNNTYPTNFGLDVSVQLIRDESKDIVRVKVLSPMYVEKEWFMDHSYSTSFTDHQILNDSDFIRVMNQAFPKDH